MKRTKQIVMTVIGISLLAALCACGKKEESSIPIPSQTQAQKETKAVVDGLEMDYEIPEGQVDYLNFGDTINPTEEEKKKDLNDLLALANAYNQDYWSYSESEGVSMQEKLDPYYIPILKNNYEVSKKSDYWSLEHVGKELGQYKKTFIPEKTEIFGIYYDDKMKIEGERVKTAVITLFARVRFEEDNPYAPKGKECYVLENMEFWDYYGEWKLYYVGVENIAAERGKMYVQGTENYWDTETTFFFRDLYAYGGDYGPEEPEMSFEEWMKQGETAGSEDE